MTTGKPLVQGESHVTALTVAESAVSERRLPALEPGDVYREGRYWVYTRQYHLRRGYCCGSGCRHCPYRDAQT